MAGCPMKSAYLLVMKNHFNLFNNYIRKQGRGGARGNKLTEGLGKNLIKRHDRKYLKLHVDPAVRFDREMVVLLEDMVEQDRDVAEDLIIMNLWKEISNINTACVQYTVDCPSLHPNCRVPVLDLKVSVKD